MRKFTSFMVAAGAMLLMGSVSQAATVFSDNFDSYANQAAFQAAWPVVGTQPTGTLSTAQAVSAPNSVRISAGSTTAVSQRNGRSFTESGAAGFGVSIIWSFDFYDAVVGGPTRQYANLQDGTAPGSPPAGQLLSLGLNNNQLATDSGGQFYMARILGHAQSAVDPNGGPNEVAGGTGSGAYFKLNDFGAAHRTVGWHNLKVVISTDDNVTTDYAFYVDNNLVELVSNVGAAGSLRSYDHIRIGSGVSSTQEAFFDNMLVESIPEPTALTLLGMAALGFLRRRRA